MPSTVLKHLLFIGGSAAKVAQYVGYAYELVVEKSTCRPYIMDGVTAGGKALAFESELLTKVSSLTQTAIDHVLTVLGIYDTLEELIVEYGGTVPTSNSVQTLSSNDDPWAEFD